MTQYPLRDENSSDVEHKDTHREEFQSSEAVTAGRNAVEQINQPQRSERLLIRPTAYSIPQRFQMRHVDIQYIIQYTNMNEINALALKASQIYAYESTFWHFCAVKEPG